MSFSSFKNFAYQVSIQKLFKKLIPPNDFIENESFESPVIVTTKKYKDMTEEQKDAFKWVAGGGFNEDGPTISDGDKGYLFPSYVNGEQALAMRATSFIQQDIYFDVGTYVFSTYFYSRNRNQNNPIQVSINDEIITTINKVVREWTLFTHTFNILVAENKTLRLEGLAEEDLTTGIDLVALSKKDGPMNSDFQNFLANKPPYAYFRATDFIEGTGKIPAKIGNFTAETSGVTLENGDGNGADVSIPFLNGTTNSNVSFNVDIPVNFTVCSITRWTSSDASKRQRILTIKSDIDNVIHGHYVNSYPRGIASYNSAISEFYNNETNDNYGNGELTDWLTMCAKNGAETIERGALADNNKIGVSNNATGGQEKLGININRINRTDFQLSDFAFSQLLIWDRVLTDDEMQDVSNYLIKYLEDGLD